MILYPSNYNTLEELKEYFDSFVNKLSDWKNLSYYQYYLAIKKKKSIYTLREVDTDKWNCLKEYCPELNKYLADISLPVAKQQIYKALEDVFFERDKKIANEKLQEVNECLRYINKLKDIKDKENLICTKSPYGDTLYLHKEDEYIDWDYKPEGSYRFSDHWNFTSEGTKHCICDEIDYKELAICIFRNGKYEKLAF